MSRTDIVDEAKAQASLELLREINSKAAIITTPIEKLEVQRSWKLWNIRYLWQQEMMEEEVARNVDMFMNMVITIMIMIMRTS